MTEQLPAFLTAEWRHLVMLNYEIDPSVLRSKIPKGTELDVWNGRTYVSVVGFRFLNTTLRGVPIPFHRHFSEVNLRFYVRHRAEKEWRRGVVFIKEIVPLPAVTLVARWVYNENYITLPMRHQVQLPKMPDQIHGSFEYSWKWHGRWTDLRVKVIGEPQPLSPGSEEEFITEHYWGYAAQRDGGTIEYGVEHPAWRTWRAESSQFECDVESLYGSEFKEAFSRPPVSSFVADGSEIVVRKGIRLV